MGREVRKVPKDWQHPKGENGMYLPMFDQDFESAAAEWKAALAAWEGRNTEALKRIIGDWIDPDFNEEFWEFYGDPPDRDFYRPKWDDAERTHFQMYESTSEGTPISPPMATIEGLARWLAENGASAFGYETATYEEWLATIRAGHAVGAVYDPVRGIRSGVAANAENNDV